MALGTKEKTLRNRQIFLKKGSGKKFRELADEYNMSQTRVKQIYYAYLKKNNLYPRKYVKVKGLDKLKKEAYNGNIKVNSAVEA